MEEDSMINMPTADSDSVVFDEKIVGGGGNNKRVRGDGEEAEILKGRLEKRPSGIFLGDHVSSGGDESGGGIIDTFISNVFQKNNTSGPKDDQGEVEVAAGGGDVKTGEDLGVDHGHGGDGDGDGDGGIIGAFFSGIFHHHNHNGSANGDKSDDHLLINEAHEEKTECRLGGDEHEHDDIGGPEDLNEEKLAEKKDAAAADKALDDDLAAAAAVKDPKGGHTTSKLKPDDYSERVFFLNNN